MTFDMELLRTCSESMGIFMDDGQYVQFFQYYDMMIEKNKVMNLTTITDMNEVIIKHFVDSLMLIKAVDPNKILTCIDVGTGAGFPGIPLKIAFPDMNIILNDSQAKRLAFLDDVIDALHLSGIETVHARAEELGQDLMFRENFDLCVSRAVANLSTLCEYCLPLVHVGGHFVAYKSRDINKELLESGNAMISLGGGLPEMIMEKIPTTDIERLLVKIPKVQKTPPKYPRKSGIPSKEPLH